MISMEFFLNGLMIALQPENLFFCFMGVLGGTLVGVLPGIGPTATVAILLPATFDLNPTTAIIMLAGINYGAAYGGSTTAILVNVPGEASSVVTCLDGYKMARQGRAGPALGISAFGSYIAGTLSIVGVMLFSPILARVGVAFGPPEYFALILTALMIVTYLVKGSMFKAWIMVALGLVLGTLGNDPLSGRERFSYGVLILRDGIGLVPLVIGMFGVSEILETMGATVIPEVFQKKVRGILPTLRDWKDSGWPIIRSSLIGFFLGIFPGMTPMIPTLLSYGVEKKLSRHPEKFGEGAIEGVAAAESCNNAASTAGFVPLFSLGIPSNAFNAVMLGALMIYGLQPGPLLIQTNPEFFWGVIASMYLGNIMLVVLNLPLIPVWISILRVPYTLLSIFIIIFCFLGSYSINNSTFDAFMTFFFGIVGFVLKRYDFELPPLILAFVLGPLVESTFRQSLMISGGDFGIFFTRPISAVLIFLAVGVIITAFIKRKPIAEIESET